MWSVALENLGISKTPKRLEEEYHAFSVAYAGKAHLEGGDKILLPPSAFEILARLQVDYPMLFRLKSNRKGTMTHSGVLEFTAEEGTCCLPFWMMQNLLIEEGSIITVANISLPKATFVKFQPQHKDFLDITNPRAVLEHALRNFSCVTKGDTICIPYNGQNYYFELQEVEPMDAACIIETDCNVDFAAPLGYEESIKADDITPFDTGIVEDPKGISNSRIKNINPLNLPVLPNPEKSVDKSIFGIDDIERRPIKAIEIVNGMVIRSDIINNLKHHNEINSLTFNSRCRVETEVLAKRSGMTGAQPNSAIAPQPPNEEYWSLNAGIGSRLDGKTPRLTNNISSSKNDLTGESVCIQSYESPSSTNTRGMPKTGKTVEGDFRSLVGETYLQAENNIIQPSLKSHIGTKYSVLKRNGLSPFEGTGNVL